MVRKGIKTLLIIFSVILSITALVIIFLSSPLAENYIKKTATYFLQEQTGFPVRIGGFETNVLSRTVIEDIAFYNEDNRIFLSINEIRLEYNLPDLLIGVHIADSLTVRAPYFNPEFLPETQKEKNTGKKVQLSENGESELKFKIAGFNLISAKIESGEKDEIFSLEIENISFDYKKLYDRSRFETAAGIIKLSYKNENYKVNKIRISAISASKALVLEQLNMSFLSGEIYARGVLGGGRNLSGKIFYSGKAGETVRVIEKISGSSIIDADGTLEFDSSISGTLDFPSFNARITSPKLEISGVLLENLNIDLSGNTSSITVSEGSFEALGSPIALKGKFFPDDLRFDEFDIEIKEGLRVKELIKILGAENTAYEGALKGKISYSGSIKRFLEGRSEFDFQIENVKHKNKELPEAEISGFLRNESFAVSFNQGESNLSLNGSVDKEIDAVFSGFIEDLGDYAGMTGAEELKGRINIDNGRIQGTYNAPLIKADITAEEAGYGQYTARSLKGRFEFGDNTISAKDLEITANFEDGIFDREKNTLGAKGNVIITPSLPLISGSLELLAGERKTYFGDLEFNLLLNENRLVVRAAEFKLDKLAVYFSIPENIEGKADLKAEMMFGKKIPTGHAVFEINDPAYEEISFDVLRGSASLEGNYIKIANLEAEKGGGNLSVNNFIIEVFSETGGFIRPDSSVSGSIRSTDLELDIFELLTGFDNVSGTADLNIMIDGFLFRPQIKGSVEISRGGFKLSPETPEIKDIEAGLSISTGSVVISGISGTVRDIPFSIEGKIRYDSNWKRFYMDIAASLKGKQTALIQGDISGERTQLTVSFKGFNIGIIDPFLKEYEVSGIANGKVSINGGLNSPDLNGSIRIVNLSFTVPFLEETIEDALLEADFRENTIRINRLRGELGDGKISANGSIDLAKDRKWALRVSAHAENIYLSSEGVFETNINESTLSVQKASNTFAVGGELDLGRTVFYQNLPLSSLITLGEAAPERPGEYTVNLDIKVSNDGDLWINNNLAYLRLDTDLRIFGTFAAPQASGNIVILEGYINYLDRRFGIQEGTLVFRGIEGLNPLINIKAATSVVDTGIEDGIEYEIIITLSGPLDDVNFELSSEPPLDRVDIVTLLTFGSTRAGLTGTTRGELLVERAQELAGRGLTGYVSRRMQRLLQLDEVDIEGNIFNVGEGGKAPVITARKQLSEKTVLTYSVAAGNFNEQSLGLGYKITDNLLLESRTSQAGESEIGLKLRLRLK